MKHLFLATILFTFFSAQISFADLLISPPPPPSCKGLDCIFKNKPSPYNKERKKAKEKKQHLSSTVNLKHKEVLPFNKERTINTSL